MDLSDAVFEDHSTDNVIIATGKGMYMKPDGLMIYISSTDGGNTAYQYPLSTAFDVSELRTAFKSTAGLIKKKKLPPKECVERTKLPALFSLLLLSTPMAKYPDIMIFFLPIKK